MKGGNDVSRIAVDALADLHRRTHTLPVPEESGFDPLVVSDEVLRRYGLPLYRDFAEGSPGYRIRRAFLSPPQRGGRLRFVPALAARGAAPSSLSALKLSAPTSAWPAQKSSNWSGAYLVPRGGGSIASIAANWTVPVVSQPTGGTAPEYRSSTWIGLDGMRAYRDSTLPQIGTQQIVSAAGDPPKAWFQWWGRNINNAGPQELSLPLQPGDEVQALITVLGPTSVRFNIKNVTQGVVLGSFDVAAPTGCVVTGGTAEWIMERPSPMGSDGWHPYPLPRYQDFSFTACLAESRAPNATTSIPMTLERATLVRMYEISGDPPRTRTLSVPSRSGQSGQRLDLHYTGP